MKVKLGPFREDEAKVVNNLKEEVGTATRVRVNGNVSGYTAIVEVEGREYYFYETTRRYLIQSIVDAFDLGRGSCEVPGDYYDN